MVDSVRIAVRPYKPMAIKDLYSLQGDLKELTDEAYSKLRSEIVNTGFAFMPHIWRDHNGKHWLVDGHQRWDALNRLQTEGFKIPKVPTAIVDAKNLTEAKHRILQGISAYGKITQLGFEHFITKAKFNPKDIQLRFDLPNFNIPNFVNSHFRIDSEKDTKEDVVPDTIKVVKVRPGELYQLGAHRLMCGDGADVKQIKHLMNDEKADMVYTDPPYGFGYKPNFYIKMNGTMNRNKNDFDQLKNDSGDWDFDASHIIKIFEYCEEIYLWGADYYCWTLPKHGSWIVWNKTGGHENLDKMPGASFELCWSRSKHKRHIIDLTWRGAFGHNKQHDGNRKMHPTQKPVKLHQWFFEKWGKDKNNIVDLYGGSGSTLIACEKAKKKCFMMEIDPHYCHVILDRYVEYAGKDPVREDGMPWSKVKTSRNVALKPRLAKP